MLYFVIKNYQKKGHDEKRLGTTDLLHHRLHRYFNLTLYILFFPLILILLYSPAPTPHHCPSLLDIISGILKTASDFMNTNRNWLNERLRIICDYFDNRFSDEPLPPPVLSPTSLTPLMN